MSYSPFCGGGGDSAEFRGEGLVSLWWEGLSGLVGEADGGWEEAALVAGGSGLSRPQSLAEGECCEEFVARMGGVGHDLAGPL